MSAKAVRCGGGYLHRLGLSETLLLFHEHRIFLDEPRAATVARLKAAQPERGLMVEVSDPEEALAWAMVGAPTLQLERFDPDLLAGLKRELAIRGCAPLLAVAGGVNASNAVAYAAAGADLLVSSAPYHARPKDVQVTFARAA